MEVEIFIEESTHGLDSHEVRDGAGMEQRSNSVSDLDPDVDAVQLGRTCLLSMAVVWSHTSYKWP